MSISRSRLLAVDRRAAARRPVAGVLSAAALLCLGICLGTWLGLGAGVPASADGLTTRDGLALEGEVIEGPEATWIVRTPQGEVVVAQAEVASLERGAAPRAAFRTRAAALEARDVRGHLALALEAEEAGLRGVAREAYGRVLATEPDHRVARRALGYSRVGEAWLAPDEAHRARGLVRYAGRWLLPAEVERAGRHAMRLPVAPDSVARTRSLLRRMVGASEAERQAARLVLAELDDVQLLEAALGTLYDRDPELRRLSARMLAELGDEAALRPLIFSGIRDADAEVRREAVLAAHAFGHDDTAVPFVRALGSKNLQVAGHAAQALGMLGDQRVVGYLVKRMTSAGSSARNFVAFLNQVSYVRDYDVEIAQASNIANPNVATLSEGVVLDAKVLGAVFSRTWLEPIVVGAVGQLVGQHFAGPDEVRAWYLANRDRLPRFVDEVVGKRAPRRVGRGKVLGAPVLD